MERALVIIKPDAMERKLMGEIISIYEKKGLHISAARIVKPSRELAENHYGEHRDKPFFAEVVGYITRGEVCALIIEGGNAVNVVRRINGATDPITAEAGSIRGRYGVSKTENSIHASDSAESAEREIKLWFPEA